MVFLGIAPACEGAPAGVQLLGRIDEPQLTECSGVVASRKYPGTFWVHNDGGGRKREVLYAMDRTGHVLSRFQIDGAKFEDWEDIAIDDQGHLYLGDLGNNDRKRDRLVVHRINEPDPSRSGILESHTRRWVLRFPERPFDCESLFVHGGYGYVIAKLPAGRPAVLYRFPLAAEQPVVLEAVATLPIVAPVTGADLSPDGRKLAVVARSGAWVFQGAGDPGQLAVTTPHAVAMRGPSIEGCCFTPEGLLATAESREVLLFTDPPFRTGK